jgi:hypothetical protein
MFAKCTVLREYMTFIDYVRELYGKSREEDLESAIEKAIDRCIEENVLRQFLIERRSEVLKVMVLDYTFDRRLVLNREESRKEGHKEGLTDGIRIGVAVNNCRKLGLSKAETISRIANDFSLSDENAAEYVDMLWVQE